MSKLQEIINYKKVDIARISQLPLRNMKRKRPHCVVKKSLINNPFICEVKKQSPSAGILNHNVDILSLAGQYANLGAGMISVLTDEKYFGGSFENLQRISEMVSTPLLCKDFIIDRKQIEYAYALGADCILIIVKALTREEIVELVTVARNLNLEILFEIHEYLEFSLIADLKPQLVGVNSRNLDDLSIDKNHGAEVLKRLNGNFLKIAGSGIKTVDDIKFFKNSGADAFLIGTSFMISSNLDKTFYDFQRGLKSDK